MTWGNAMRFPVHFTNHRFRYKIFGGKTMLENNDRGDEVMEIKDKFSRAQIPEGIKVLFIPTTDRDCEMFVALVNYLTNASINTISLDNLYMIGDGTGHKLEHFGIPYSRIDFNTEILSFFKETNPSILVVSNDGSVIERSFVLVANKLGIPTLLIQVGCFSSCKSSRTLGRMFKGLKSNLLKIVFDKSVLKTWYMKYSILIKTIISINDNRKVGAAVSFLRMVTKDSFSNDERGKYCKYVCVSSNYDRNILISKGVDPINIFVTGSPKYSKINNTDYNDADIRKRLDLTDERKIVIFLTPSLADHGCMTKNTSDHQIKNTIKKLAGLESIHLIVKVHPNESKEDYMDLLKDYSANLTFVKHEIELYSLMHIADLIIAINSTCIVESIIMGKQVVNLNYIADAVTPEIQGYDLIRCVYDIDNLANQVNECLNNVDEVEYFYRMRDKFFIAYSSLSPENNGAKEIAKLMERITHEVTAPSNL